MLFEILNCERFTWLWTVQNTLELRRSYAFLRCDGCRKTFWRSFRGDGFWNFVVHFIFLEFLQWGYTLEIKGATSSDVVNGDFGPRFLTDWRRGGWPEGAGGRLVGGRGGFVENLRLSRRLILLTGLSGFRNHNANTKLPAISTPIPPRIPTCSTERLHASAPPSRHSVLVIKSKQFLYAAHSHSTMSGYWTSTNPKLQYRGTHSPPTPIPTPLRTGHSLPLMGGSSPASGEPVGFWVSAWVGAWAKKR